MLTHGSPYRGHGPGLTPDALDYPAVPGLSTEIRERLAEIRPRSLGQASRIPGVTPAAISILTVWCHRGRPAEAAAVAGPWPHPSPGGDQYPWGRRPLPLGSPKRVS